MHMNILAALLTGIKDRQLDNYFQVEENVMKQTKAQVLEIIKDETKGKDPLDKLRLFIIWFLSTEQDVSTAEWNQFKDALAAAGVDIACLPYIRQYVFIPIICWGWMYKKKLTSTTGSAQRRR